MIYGSVNMTMKKQQLLLILSIIFSAIFLKSAQANSYQCLIKVSEKEEKFNFDTTRDKSGTGGSFMGMTYFISVSNSTINLRVQNTKNKTLTKSFYNVDRENFELSQTPGFVLGCYTKKSMPRKKVKTKVIEKLILNDEVRLDKFANRISFKAASKIKVIYNVKAAHNRMRAIIFQNAKMYSLDDDNKRDVSGSWCIFQLQLDLDQDTMIQEGDSWKTVTYQSFNNSSTHTTYSYSFIDPSKGKISQKFKRYRPFNLVCQIKKGQTFNRKLWREIIGDRVTIYANP